MNFTPMKNAIERAEEKRVIDIRRRWRNAKQQGSSGSAQKIGKVNGDLLKVSRLFLNEKGLPERPWFKNQVYAPGAYTGYGAKPIAAVREYMDEKKWVAAESQIPMVAVVLARVATGINKAAADLEAATPHK